MKDALIGQLGRFLSRLSFEDLPPAVVERAKACLLNSLAATLGGYDIDLSKKAIAVAKKMGTGPGSCRILIDGARVSALASAFANSTMSCSRTQNDTHFETVAHVGEIVPPVCLAVGEEKKVSGKSFINAMVAGYEAMARVGKGGTPFTIRRGFRSTPVFGTFGASVAAGKLLGLNEEAITNALGYAANFSSGLLECWHGGTPEYGFQAGVSAQNGIMAALIAAEGGAATPTTLEGSKGFYGAYAGTQENIARVLDGLGKTYEMEEVVFKKFPGELFNQPVIETFLKMIQEHVFTAQEITKVRVKLDPVAANYPGVANRGPFHTYLDALVSCPFVIGTLAVHKQIGFESYSRFQDHRILNICEKVDVEQEERSSMSCAIELHLSNGSRLSKDLGLSIASYRMSLDGATAFFKEVALPLLGAEKTAQAVGAVLSLESETNLGRMVDYLIK